MMKSALLLLHCCLLTTLSAMASEPPLSRIAFGSCVREDKPQPIWDAVIRAQPQLLILAGDNIYADTDDPAVMRDKYARQATHPGYVYLRSVCPVLATWDDHDYGRNDAGQEYEQKEAAQAAFLDYFQVSADSPRRRQRGIYHTQIFGAERQRVQVILLDTRYFRSSLQRQPTVLANGKPYQGYVATTTPGATFLGEEQWSWLEAELRRPAELRLLVSSIQVVSEEHVFEKWANIPAERERLFRLLRDTGANGVVVLSGDRHLADLSVMDAGLGYPLYDLTASGLTEASQDFRYPETNRHRIAGLFTGTHFGMVEVDWTKDDPTVGLQIRDGEGRLRLQECLPLSRLRPVPAVGSIGRE